MSGGEDLAALLALAGADAQPGAGASAGGAPAPTALGKRPRPAPASDADVEVEEFSGVRISRRTVAAAEVRQALAGRVVVPLRRLAASPAVASAAAAAAAAAPGGGHAATAPDVVTIGVLVHRGPPRLGPSGGTYQVWRLSDFGADVTLFLWGAAYEAFRRECEGGLFLLSCPDVLPARERSAFALKVSAVAQLSKLGTCPTFALCAAARKDGAPCTMAVDTAVSRRCVHHMGAEYSRLLKEVSTGRGELVRQTNSACCGGGARRGRQARLDSRV